MRDERLSVDGRIKEIEIRLLKRGHDRRLPDTFFDWHIIIFVHQSTPPFYISSGSPLDSFDSLIDGKVQIRRKTSVEPVLNI